MGYLHIDNLYKNRDILLFRECWALEKVHGTSAHIQCKADGEIRFFSGGANHTEFAPLFSEECIAKLKERPGVTVYGEAYGGKMQKMSETYGKTLRFIAFDVKVGEHWLEVDKAVGLVESLGLEFVPHCKSSTDIAALDALRDAPSEVAVRRGITEPRQREGVVLRPLMEVLKKNGERIICKHKGAGFQERASQPKEFDPEKHAAMADAEKIALEWVTPMRLEHILGRGTIALAPENIPAFIAAMVEDVEREAAGEIITSKEARKSIGHATAQLVKAALDASLRAAP